MTHPQNKGFLPPLKSDREYEAEIDALKQRLVEINSIVERAKQRFHYQFLEDIAWYCDEHYLD